MPGTTTRKIEAKPDQLLPLPWRGAGCARDFHGAGIHNPVSACV